MLERYPAAQWVPVLPSKYGYSAYGRTAPKRGVVTHSAEGWERYLRDTQLDPSRHASWQFSILLDGRVLQHAPPEANCWHAGDTDSDDNVRANIDLEGWEFEGVAGTPITDAQAGAAANLYGWHQQEYGWQPYELWRTAYEHNWVSDEATACPSGRIRHEAIRAATMLGAPVPAPLEEDQMQIVMLKEVAHDAVWLTDWVQRRHVASQAEVDQLRYIGVLGPVTVPQSMIGAIPLA